MPRDFKSTGPGDGVRLRHMLDAALDVQRYIVGRSRADLDKDSMLLRALVQALQVIGEAAARTSEEGRLRAPGLPWPKIVGMRHILVHVYYDIDADAVWRVSVEDVPHLITSLRAALGESESGGS